VNSPIPVSIGFDDYHSLAAAAFASVCARGRELDSIDVSSRRSVIDERPASMAFGKVHPGSDRVHLNWVWQSKSNYVRKIAAHDNATTCFCADGPPEGGPSAFVRVCSPET
jgi:hypothetical protein